ncbi:hypothetical protein FOCG_11600 [Fusarium oxysporum f. sp. radicis-lycopersici 26381]|uniref:Uncharacterized protein n=3 Tax=Fusarium oxysporum TaxID=5507 RepID=A0A0J9USB9_FUSO4|nr:hypothetical protein FOXG_18835 [Fusarium oxysporum f. sp. lycopersici 4287]EWZ46467.1 hypothetical protein FOZG_02605 [Fusarium oxysporum Fo47]EXK43764.1 hypothetical protein FOMG_02684 [Fusarium oxysporum f. sp. melonis 26406]EXL47425.1 hypothetical protein FOCG_11600 [Fusarium oxysporum f. sp. radicis-lycopersici 26381]KNB01151.1 hypothetical protein FOXG_18835 [Fusarium oxysporum f. sp. lycopersici 4287]
MSVFLVYKGMEDLMLGKVLERAFFCCGICSFLR